MKITLEYFDTKGKGLGAKENIDFIPRINEFIQNLDLKNHLCSGSFVVFDVSYHKIDGKFECEVYCQEVNPDNLEEERAIIKGTI